MSKRRKSTFKLTKFELPKIKRDSKNGAILYLMVHCPFFWWWKIGITGKSAGQRARSIDKVMFGFPVPVMILFIPGAYFVEQDLHRHFSVFNFRFYEKDGASEWFWFPVAFVVLPLLISGWMGYVWLFDLCFGTNFFYLTLHFIVDNALKLWEM